MDTGGLDRRDSTSARGWSKKNTAAPAAIGRSRGGLTTRIHAAVDALGNAVQLHLSGGEAADCTHFAHVLQALPEAPGAVVADKAYDTNAIVEAVAARGATVVIPATENRKQEREIDNNLYEDRNKVERFFGASKSIAP